MGAAQAYAEAMIEIPLVSAVSATADAPASSVEAVSTLDATHNFLAQEFVGMVGDIDRFFGDDRNYQESNQSVLQLDVSRVSGYGGNNQLTLSGRAKVNLPNTEQRLHLLIESDPDKNIGGNPPLIQPGATATTPGSYAAGLRYEKEQTNRWFFSTDAGVKFQGFNSSLFTRARASYAAALDDDWRVKLAETPFWFNTLGAGMSSQLDLERAISAPLLFRASSNVTWLNDKQNFDLRQDVSVYHTLDERAAVLYQISAIGASQPQFHATDYVLFAVYRYRLHQKWMFLEVSPQLHYPQARQYQASPAISLRLEILFDKNS